MKDRLLRALARSGRVRIFICDTTNLVNEVKNKHDLWPTASAALGRTLSVGTIMGAMLKDKKEKLTIQINGGGPIGTVMVDAFSDGRVRGFVGDGHVHFQYNDTGKLAVGVAVGKEGYLKVIKSMSLKEDFSGQVALQTGEIGDDFAYYFAVSEQTPSVVSVGVLVDTDNSILASGGLIVQMMPDATEEDIVKTEEILKTLKPMSTLIHEGNSLEDILHSLYDDVEILSEIEPRFECTCSREKMKAALTTLDKQDRLDMIKEDHGCECVCQFCGEKYFFDEAELISLEQFIEMYGKKKHVEN